MFGYADDSNLVTVMPSPRDRVEVAESLDRDRSRVSLWWDLLRMRLTASKTMTMIVSRSRSMHYQSS